MKLKILNGEPICIDGNPILKNLKVNVTEFTRQIHIKATAFDSDKQEFPVNITINQYQTNILPIDLSAYVVISGRDMIKNKSFQIKAEYLIKKTPEVKLTGRIGSNPIKINFGGIEDLPKLQELLNYFK